MLASQICAKFVVSVQILKSRVRQKQPNQVSIYPTQAISLTMGLSTNDRYDRQVRLWGLHGQSKCLNSNICLINADSLGTEILKGLCLAGIGSFTILDSHKVVADDIGSSFIPRSCFGKSRASSVKQVLLNLNEDVKGEAYPLESFLPRSAKRYEETDLSSIFPDEHKFFSQFNCVIASGQLSIAEVELLSKICWTLSCPLILCKSIGFYGMFRSQIKDHVVIETHPDNVLTDFSLDRPFPNLKKYFDNIDLDDEANSDKISSYPYVVIVYKYLRKWQEQHGYPTDQIPQTFNEKRDLRALIEADLRVMNQRRKNSSHEDNQETISAQTVPYENFLDACKATNSCFTLDSKTCPAAVNDIFNSRYVDESPTPCHSRFWLIIRALRDFVKKNNGRLPISGSIPDMTSSSEEYLKLQSIYNLKAKEDVDEVFGFVQNIMSENTSLSTGSLYDETKLICKHVRDLQLINTEPIFREYTFKERAFSEVEEEDEFLVISLCLRALDTFFYSTYSRLPGCQDAQVETDLANLKDCVKQLIGKNLNRLKFLDQCLYEVCRFGGAELHATSAFLGGCIAQEVIKLLTNQYVPIDNTLVYNATSASVKTFRLSDILA